MFGVPMPVFTSQLLLLIAPPALCQSPSIVSTPQGIYHPNTSIPGVEQFLGIRYAEPPVGALRFAAPAPYASGDAAQHVDATRYGPACLQDAGFEAANGLSEDCLTLNIFRPAAASIAPNTSTSNYTTDDNDEPRPLLPVLVYIYGGANIGGQARHYSAANLVLHSLGLLPPPPPSPVPLNHTTTRAPPATPVLTITLNYRTGALGFLANTLFARRGLLNAGLKDQRLALQWVRDHVRAFGGDPARVTVFGQSAGAFDVWMQVRYEAYHNSAGGERPLFRGAILESGGPGSLALRGVEPRMGDAFLRGSLEALGCGGVVDAGDEAALKCLRGVGTARLMEVWFDARSALYNTLDAFVQLPVGFGVDGEWVGGEDYWDEAAAQIPMIIGDVLNEGSLYGLVPTGLATNETYLTQVVATVLGDAVQDIPRRVNLGRHASGADALNRTTSVKRATANSSEEETGAKTWGYRWSQRPPLSTFDEKFYGFPPDVPEANKVRAGVLHAAELGSVFGDVYGWGDAGERDRRLAGLVQSMWIAFARDLDPNSHGIPDVPHWDNYNPLSAAIFNFEDQGPTTPSMVPDDMRLDSYNAYKDAAAKAGLPPLPEIRV
ncbi:hypothetical protein SLS54_007957 [Diplodia seriata]